MPSIRLRSGLFITEQRSRVGMAVRVLFGILLGVPGIAGSTVGSALVHRSLVVPPQRPIRTSVPSLLRHADVHADAASHPHAACLQQMTGTMALEQKLQVRAH